MFPHVKSTKEKGKEIHTHSPTLHSGSARIEPASASSSLGTAAIIVVLSVNCFTFSSCNRAFFDTDLPNASSINCKEQIRRKWR